LLEAGAMATRRIPILTHSAGWLALAYLLALSLPFLYGAFADGDGGALGGALVAATWTAAPVVAAAAFVGASPSRPGAAFFFLVELLLIASFGWEFATMPATSTSGFIFLSWPLLQWSVILVSFLFALRFGWRMRPDFMME
jgi:hypothetical protein